MMLRITRIGSVVFAKDCRFVSLLLDDPYKTYRCRCKVISHQEGIYNLRSFWRDVAVLIGDIYDV